MKYNWAVRHTTDSQTYLIYQYTSNLENIHYMHVETANFKTLPKVQIEFLLPEKKGNSTTKFICSINLQVWLVTLIDVTVRFLSTQRQYSPFPPQSSHRTSALLSLRLTHIVRLLDKCAASLWTTFRWQSAPSFAHASALILLRDLYSLALSTPELRGVPWLSQAPRGMRGSCVSMPPSSSGSFFHLHSL